LRSLIDTDQDGAGPYLALADLESRRELNEARLYAEAALARDPDGAAAWVSLIRLGKLSATDVARRPEYGRASEATRLFATGVALSRAGGVRESIEALTRAHGLRPADWDIAGALYGAHLSLGLLPETRTLLEQVLRQAQDGKDAERVAITNGRLGELLLNLNEFQSAIPILSVAATTLSQLGLRAAAQARRQSLALAHYYAGDYESASREAEQAWREARDQGHKPNEGRALGLMATLSYQMGDFGRAADWFERALALAREADDQGSEADLRAGLAELYGVVGQPMLALRMARSAVFEAHRKRKVWLEGRLLVTLGVTAAQNGRLAEAEAAYGAAAGQVHSNRDWFAEADVLIRRGDLRLAMRRWTAAHDLFTDALAIARRIDSRTQELRARVGVGRSALHLGRAAEAVAEFEAALQLSEGVGSLTQSAAALTGLGKARQASGNIAMAAEAYRRAIEQIERARGNVGAPDERAAFLATQTEAYRGLVDCLLRSSDDPDGRLQEAFATAEAVRARSFAEMLGIGAGGNAGLGPQTRAREQLESRITAMQLRGHSSSSGTAPSAELVKAQEEYQLLQWKLQRGGDPQSAKSEGPPSLATVRAALPADALLLEYSLGESRSWLFVVSSERVTAVSLPPARRIEEAGRRLREALTLPRAIDRTKLLSSARRLYEFLLEPALVKYPRKRRLIVAGDGALHSIPFEALVATARPELPWQEQSFVAKRWEVRYIPSARVWLSLRGRVRPPQGLLAFGGIPAGSENDRGWSALPFSTAEVRTLAALYGSHGLVRTGADATEERWRKDVATGDFGVLHMATHGVLNSRFPWFSGLVLAKSRERDGSDGILQGFEIARVRLPQALVVLSACETGLGRALDGEGLTGLTQAFLIAGASSAIVSLWRVEDRHTSEFMTVLHRKLTAGDSPASALRRARLALLNAPETAHPYYWAAFVLTGGGPL
jgi:CHAT domain-containing protein